MNNDILKSDEEIVYRLRALYDQYGYTRYKVSKFEKYDLYAKNKSFLICENILTFTDTNGALMALKPDVTLSIVKNFSGEKTSKLYYSERVYRTSTRSEGFREIRQTGLECIGHVDCYLMGEVIMLAERSLAEIGRAHILDLSHMGFLLGLLEACGVEERSVDEALSLISNKNLPGIAAFVASNGLDEAARALISDVTSIYEPLETALPRLATFVRSEKMRAAYDELSSLCEVMRAWNPNAPLYLDFSIAADRNYYNGIVFRGYVEGIPEAILSGGRYDSLLSRMGRKGEAIGFAVYPELIAGLGAPRRAYDVDAVVLYGEETDACDLIAAVQELSASGKSVRTECGEDTETSCREKYRMNGRTAVRV